MTAFRLSISGWLVRLQDGRRTRASVTARRASMSRNTQRVALLAALVLSAQAGRAADAVKPAASPALERFKALAGDWVAAEDGEMSKKGDLVARYAVTA